MIRKTVLIVEDNDDLRSHFSDALAMAGFVVQQAADGMEALRSLDAAPPDIVVLDLGLPHVSGYEVLFELKEHSYTRQIPVVVVSGAPQATDDLAMHCFLQKPVQAADLVRTVQQCLDHASQ